MVPLMGEWMLADLAFHMLLLRVAGNRQVVKVIADKQIMIQMFRHRTDAPEAWNRPLSTYYRDNYELHRDIAEAVGRRDARRGASGHGGPHDPCPGEHARPIRLAPSPEERRRPLGPGFPRVDAAVGAGGSTAFHQGTTGEVVLCLSCMDMWHGR